MPRAKTNEEYYTEVNKINTDIEITGFYKNGNSKMHCKCKICGYEWISTARNLLKPKKCLGCFHTEKIFEYPDISREELCETVSKIYPSLIITGTYYKELKLISCTCKDYGYHSRIRVQMLLEKTYKCPICKDGNSLGEKYFYQVIKSIDKNIEVEKYLNGNMSYRYDFYGIVDNNTWICEIQGKQHSEKSFHTLGGRTLEEEIENDRLKRDYALSQGIDYYIQIDSKERGFNQLKEAIINSKLSELYSFDNVD